MKLPSDIEFNFFLFQQVVKILIDILRDLWLLF